MKFYFQVIIALLLISCGKTSQRQSIEWISRESLQDSLFSNLQKATLNAIPDETLNDSLSFLILPLHASCPGCRRKTIDSLMNHKRKLLDRHYIIITADGGRKTMNTYFKEQGRKLPDIEGRLFLDSTNFTYKHDLFKNNPCMYYSFNKKVYKKVSALPSTVREDLREFFSGFRMDEQDKETKMQAAAQGRSTY